MGFKSEGEAIVLSTIKGTLASLACLLIPSKSITSSFGFPKDSAKKTLVFGLTASLKLSTLSGSTKVVVMPNLGSVLLSMLYVPPYRLFDATIWSPDFNKVIKVVAIAEVPEAVATAATPPSTAANLCSKTSLVGLLSLVYM